LDVEARRAVSHKSITMAPNPPYKKRRASLVESNAGSDELNGVLEGVLSQSEDDTDLEGSGEDGIFDDEEEEDDEQSEESDEDGLGTSSVREGGKLEPPNGELSELTHEALEPDSHVNGYRDSAAGDDANFSTATDANGNVRYVYEEIDPVYESDDTDAQEAENTIGNIPLSFYE
jgi:ribosome biogenesis protein ERB1